MITPRPYQQAAAQAAFDWIRKSTDPCVIHAPTGAGKSIIIAVLAKWLRDVSGGKKVLATAPSGELVTQNAEKYRLTGEPASLFSASTGEVSMRHGVVFGTPATIKNKIRRFGAEFTAVIIDECHRITPQLTQIIEHMKALNPNLRIIGLSATPYRLGEGYIFKLDESGKPMGEQQARDPYFTARVFTIKEHDLIAQGFLTPPVVGETGAEGYETLHMLPNASGNFRKADIDAAYHGHGRKTSQIVADVVRRSVDRKGVMLFAASIEHGEEIMASLNPHHSAIVTGKTKAAERRAILDKFKAQKIKYLVSVATLTTGFDAPHVDVVALLRATESVSLLQQIIGRGLRLGKDKPNCLILDYAENIDRHCPDGDIFSPEIKAGFRGGESTMGTIHCPLCGIENEFSKRPNDEGYQETYDGYFADLAGNQIMTDYGPLPTHYGRRCMGMVKQGPTFVQCGYRWTFKACPACEGENDIAARRCSECKAELINPNEKLRADFKAFKKDPTQVQTDTVLDWGHKSTISRAGNECVVVDFVTEWRSFAVWYHPSSKARDKVTKWEQIKRATDNFSKQPTTVTYSKCASSGFYNVHAFEEPIDEVRQD